MVMRITPGRRGERGKGINLTLLEWKKKNQQQQLYLFLELFWIMSASWPYYVPIMFAMNEVHTRSNQMKSFVLT